MPAFKNKDWESSEKKKKKTKQKVEQRHKVKATKAFE